MNIWYFQPIDKTNSKEIDEHFINIWHFQPIDKHFSKESDEHFINILHFQTIDEHGDLLLFLTFPLSAVFPMFPTKETVLFFSATGKRSAVKLSPFLEWTGHCCPTTWKEKQKLCDISLMLDFWHIGRVFLWNIWNICPGLPTLASSLGVGAWNKNQGFRFSRYLKAIFASSHKSKQSASMLYIQNIPKILVLR